MDLDGELNVKRFSIKVIGKFIEREWPCSQMMKVSSTNRNQHFGFNEKLFKNRASKCSSNIPWLCKFVHGMCL